MSLSPETLDRLEAQARAQQGKEIGTGVVVTPGELLALIEYARHPLFLVDPTTQRIEPVLGPTAERSTTA